MAAKTILVVADKETDRNHLQQLVADAGYRVLGIESGAKALKTINDEKPDLIVLDVFADDMDGFKTCRELSVNPDSRDIPVVMISDQSQPVDELWAAQQGASGIIYKPYSPDDVLKHIRRLA